MLGPQRPQTGALRMAPGRLALRPQAWFLLLLTGPALGNDLNQASRAEIESVRGVGVELAQRVLTARAQQTFHDWSDARRRVKGLGVVALRGFAEAGFQLNGEPAPATGSATGTAAVTAADSAAAATVPVRSPKGQPKN